MAEVFPQGASFGPAHTTATLTKGHLSPAADPETGATKRVARHVERSHMHSVEPTSSAEQDWTTQYGLRVDHADCEITAAATADEWPVGEVRHVISPSERFRILVPSGHSLNDVVDGESPWFGGPAEVQASTPTVSLLRVSATLWVWWATPRSRVQRVTELDAAIEDDVDAVAIDTSDAGDLTFPEIVKGKQIRIYTQYLGGTITLRPLSEDNYVNGSSSFSIVRDAFMTTRCYVFTAVVFEGVLQWSCGDVEGFLVSSVLPTVMSIYNDVEALEVWRLTAEVQLEQLLTPPPGDELTDTVAWTTQSELWLQHDEALVTVDLAGGDPDDETWLINESKALAVDNDGAFGFELTVPAGHTLNGIVDGTSGPLAVGFVRAADEPLYSILVTRRAPDAWVWR